MSVNACYYSPYDYEAEEMIRIESLEDIKDEKRSMVMDRVREIGLNAVLVDNLIKVLDYAYFEDFEPAQKILDCLEISKLDLMCCRGYDKNILNMIEDERNDEQY